MIVRCSGCGYAANAEKAVSRLDDIVDDATGTTEVERFATPGVTTIAALEQEFGVEAKRQIKTLVYLMDDELVLILMRGDHALVEQKLIDLTGATRIRPAAPEEIFDALGASPGSLGAVGVKELRVIADDALRGRGAMTTGANHDGEHLRGVDLERDIDVDVWGPLRGVTQGEPCVRCGTALELTNAIEVGHIFKLGDGYTKTFGITVTDRDGNETYPIMGSYGIGVERCMATIVERHHDHREPAPGPRLLRHRAA